MTALGKLEKLILATEINDKVVNRSTIMDDKTKEAFKNLSKSTRAIIERTPKMSAYGLNSLKSALLTYWNESINPDTENFWTALKENGIDYERKEPLRFALDKNRFRRVEQSMDARQHWSELKKRKEIRNNFSTSEIENIERIIEEDKKRRVEILKKCLRKRTIPQTQYLKFGECMAYMTNCGLWDSYFSMNDRKTLDHIWRNFEPR